MRNRIYQKDLSDAPYSMFYIEALPKEIDRKRPAGNSGGTLFIISLFYRDIDIHIADAILLIFPFKAGNHLVIVLMDDSVHLHVRPQRFIGIWYYREWFYLQSVLSISPAFLCRILFFRASVRSHISNAERISQIPKGIYFVEKKQPSSTRQRLFLFCLRAIKKYFALSA